MIKAVFFDVGNTLLFPYPSVSEVCRQVLARSGHERELEDIDRYIPLVDAYYEDTYRADDTFWTSEHRTSEVWVGMYSLLCRELGIEEDAEKLARDVYDEFGDSSRWRAYDDVLPAFQRFSDRGARLGVISNWDDRLEDILKGMGLAKMLDVIVSSASVGMHKPDPRIFEHACEMIGVAPAEAVHVGDHHYADILGASSVGMTPVLIDRQRAHENDSAISTLDSLESELGLTE